MNQKSLVAHYHILKALKTISHTIYKSKNDDMPYRLKWDLAETDTDEYVLFCTKSNATLQLVRVNKAKGSGYTLATFEVAHKSYQDMKNNIYNKGNGFTFNGDVSTLNYVEPGQKEPVELECLPLETVRNLLLDEGLEELEFQYGTLHNFIGNAFEMYSIFSLLHNVDDICTPIDSSTRNRLSFLGEICDDNVVDALVLALNELQDKIVKDLEYAQ